METNNMELSRQLLKKEMDNLGIVYDIDYCIGVSTDGTFNEVGIDLFVDEHYVDSMSVYISELVTPENALEQLNKELIRVRVIIAQGGI
ncbi:hypothetical protein [Clostridium lacusfryxellense]|uniref:hypothetical protein n=1 Tax=Clostridium lacusfryxellense TaxID=205328 RepID=UPI001C0D6A2A|nr:hypothetical protein [Clostridium lacusfryxellense]MBU3112138.1 hypothetical protein [Clostridium lacusfryxellense]